MGERNRIPIYIVDAFTDEKFRGNPAAVCVLEHPLAEDVMQKIAAEMNLSETAFVYPIGGEEAKGSGPLSLRWFTPKVEVPLCGHGTLATSYILFFEIGISSEEINYETKSGRLTARREGDAIVLNFPSNPPEPADPPLLLLEAMGIDGYETIALTPNAGALLVHLADEETVKNLRPDFEAMKKAETEREIIGVIVTAKGSPPFDFVSRFFPPWVGINEDPVTGAAHTVLAPYWSRILDKREMQAFQASERGGKLTVRLSSDNRVELIGKAVVVVKGELYI